MATTLEIPVVAPPTAPVDLFAGEFVVYTGSNAVFKVVRLDYRIQTPDGDDITCYFVEHPSGTSNHYLIQYLEKVSNRGVAAKRWRSEQRAFQKIRLEALALSESILASQRTPA